MGGHSKKHGKGGGGGGGGRNKPPEQRKKLSKDLGVPDLKKAAQNLVRTARGRDRSAFSIPALRGSGSGPLLLRAAAVSGSGLIDGVGGEAERVAAQRRAMTSLAVQCAERVHQYEAPRDWFGADDNNNNNYNNNNNEDNGGSAMRQHEDVDRRGADQSLRRFYKEFHKVVENCDVLLQVVDARDPLGCRLKQLERTIRSQYGDERKRIVMVLNKVDLLPSKDVEDAWIRFFEEHEGIPCVPFAATVKGAQGNGYIANMFRRLRALALNEETGARKSIVVGVIGYPNVGKSSVINALKRKHVVGVGNMPGFTTGNTEVELRSDIRVMDCPGVVSPGEDSGDVVLRNAVKISDLANPFTPVQRLLHRCTHLDTDDPQWRHLLASGIHPLAVFYNIGSFDVDDVMSFIRLVGLRRGRLRQGGAIDEEETARMILQDWNDGRIAYYTLPPNSDLFGRRAVMTNEEQYEAEEECQAGPQVVTSLANGLEWEGLPTFHLSWRSNSKKKRFVQSNNMNDDDSDEEI